MDLESEQQSSPPPRTCRISFVSVTKRNLQSDYSLLKNTDWQTALLILGTICLINCFFGLLFKPLNEKGTKVTACGDFILNIFARF